MSIISAGGAVVGAGAAAGYQIERSLRFNSADSAYLNRTPGTAGNRKTWTWSGWVKRSKFGDDEVMFSGGVSDPTTVIRFSGEGAASPDGLRVFHYAAGFQFDLTSTAQFRDPSAWYHILVACDTTQATSSNRIKIYVNGVQVTAFDTATYPSLNYDTSINNTVAQNVGRAGAGSNYLNGYLTEINFIDGQALDPTSFGEFNTDTGVWQPIEYTGSYGTNGFYLNFSDNASTTTLGEDQAGSNDWTTNNFSVTAGAGNDSLVDTPTNYGTDTGVGGEVRGNYCTWNPLDSGATEVITNGNLDVKTNVSATYSSTRASFGVSSGKWYWEVTCNAPSPTASDQIGIGTSTAAINNYFVNSPTGYGYAQSSGQKWNNNSGSSYGATYTTTDVIGVALDMDAGTLTFYKNGVSQGTAFSSLSGTFFPMIFIRDTTGSYSANFGQRPFAYTAPSGFKALCTQNLPEPTVVQGDEHFNTVIYTGDGSNPRGITGVGFQPDFVWLKNRSAGWGNRLSNAVVGANYALETNNTNAELFQNQYGYLTSFNSDGFTVTAGVTADYFTNSSGNTYVAWNWKANGAGVSNTDGTITSTVSANTDSGFSIVTYTGTGSAATVGHGLGAVPRMIIVKNRDAADAWQVYHAANTANPETDYLVLNTTAATADAADRWNDTLPTSTVFSIGNGVEVNTNTEDYVAYCFAPISGYSAIGSYLGNGSADGPFVYTGFRPAFVFGKDSSSTNNWFIFDSVRDTYNVAGKILRPNLSDAELDSPPRIDLLSNGFKVRSAALPNDPGQTYIYMAFAENPFKYSLAR
jgi:hypothetical protein